MTNNVGLNNRGIHRQAKPFTNFVCQRFGYRVHTTAFPGMAPKRMQAVNLPENEHMRVGKVNSCYAYAEHREVIAQLWPDLYQPKGKPAGS